jgi:hypothetical protein
VRLPRFEPGSSAWQSVKNGAFGKIDLDWDSFEKYLRNQEFSERWFSQVLNTAMKYSDCLFSRNLAPIGQLSPSLKSKVLQSLSALAKFQGCYEEYLKLIKNYGLTWSGRSADDIIIDRLNKTDDPESVFQWIKDVKEAAPNYSAFMDFISVTGLRLTEAINSYNLIISLTKEGFLAEKYYNVNTGFLEHFRFKETFIRDCKKAFLSFVPLEMLDLIGKQKTINKNHLLNKALARKHILQRFGDVRENHATFAIQWLRSEEIDFLHGRVTASVFSSNYFNPKLISDLKARAAQSVQAILLKVNSELLLKIDTDLERIKALGGDLNGKN